MIGIILLLTVVICLLSLLIALIYVRQTEIRLTDKSVDLGDVLPIQTITEDAIINGNGDITVGYRLFLPEVFTLSENDAQYIHERLEALFKMLPAGTVVHQQAFYYKGEYHNTEYSTNALVSENNRHFEGKEILNSYTNLYVTFTNGKRNGKIRKNASGTSLMRKLHYPFKQPFKDYRERLSEMEAFLLNFENGLASIQQFEIRKMNSQELNNAIYDYINLSYETPTDDATQKTVNPMAINQNGDMKIGQQFVAMLSLTNEGEHLHELVVPHTGKSKSYGGQIEVPDSIKSKCSMLYPVGLGLPFDHIVNVVIEITDPDATVTAIGAEKDALNYITNFYPPASEKQREQEAFCNEITKFDYQTAYTAFNVIVNDTDKTTLMRKIALVQQGYSFMNQSSCYVENAELCNLFFTNIPGNARANYRGFINTTKQAICYLQKEGMYLSDSKGHIYNDRFGTPVRINLWDYPTLNNKNRIVIGPSGSGKSTLLRCITQLETVSDGSIRICGEDLVRKGVYAHKKQLRQVGLKVGLVFQNFNLFPHFSVLKNITEAQVSVLGLKQSVAEERAWELLKKVGLSEKEKSYPFELSGGQQQRVAIARAMVTDPSIILADEPTGALDQKTGAQIMELFEQLNNEGKTIIMITHDPKIARRAKRIVHILDGKLYSEEEYDSIFDEDGVRWDERPNIRERRRRRLDNA